MRTIHIALNTLVLLFAYGCAHLDNGHLRSAEPLPAGELRTAHAHSSSYSFAPGLALSPDSLDIYSDREKRPLYSLQHPMQLEVGLGKGFSVGGQICLWLGKDYQFRGYEDISLHLAPSVSGKAFLQWSAHLSKDSWLAISPAINAYTDIQIPHRNMLLKQRITGIEYPLTYTIVNFHTDHKTSNSFTIRYAEHWVKGDLKFRVPDVPFTWNTFLFKQPEQKVYRVAAIYTFNYERAGKGRFTNLGIELTSTLGNDVTVMPVFGMSWYSDKVRP